MFSSSPSAASGRVRQVAASGAGLDHHHADRVGDDVVQLAGDAGPLLGDTLAGQDLPFPLGPLGPVGERVEVLAAPPHVVAEHQRRRQHADGRDGLDDGDLVVGDAQDEQHADGDADPDGRPQPWTSLAVGADGVDRHDQPDQVGADHVEQLADDLGPGDDDQHGDRVPPAVHQRQRGGDDEGRRPPRGAADGVGCVEVRRAGVHHERDHGEHDGQRRVGAERMGLGPGDRSTPRLDGVATLARHSPRRYRAGRSASSAAGPTTISPWVDRRRVHRPRKPPSAPPPGAVASWDGDGRVRHVRPSGAVGGAVLFLVRHPDRGLSPRARGAARGHRPVRRPRRVHVAGRAPRPGERQAARRVLLRTPGARHRAVRRARRQAARRRHRRPVRRTRGPRGRRRPGRAGRPADAGDARAVRRGRRHPATDPDARRHQHG